MILNAINVSRVLVLRTEQKRTEGLDRHRYRPPENHLWANSETELPSEIRKGKQNRIRCFRLSV